MADSAERQKAAPELHTSDADLTLVNESKMGTVKQLRAKDIDSSESYTIFKIGERDINKPHKIILLVGETGTGKTTLIEVMINYMLGVKREDNVWFEITDEQSERSQAHSQTSIITVLEFYHPDSPIDLTIIDTPGYEETMTIEKDEEIGKNLLDLLSKSKERICKIDLVCLVMKSTQTRLTDRQTYILDAIQSLFAHDMAENIVLLLTFSRGAIPKDVLTAVKETHFKCAVDEENQPVYFMFDNCQARSFDEKNEMQEQSWNLSFKGIEGFFNFLKNIKPKPLKMTKGVLQKRQQLESKISSIESHGQTMSQKQSELTQTQAALEKHKNAVEENKDFEDEVEVTYREKVDIDRSLASVATCCSVCEENCHYPGCWWISNISKCEMMKDSHCIVCTNKCHISKHVKEDKIYETKTKKEKRTKEDLKKKYDDSKQKISDVESEIKELEKAMQTLNIEKVKLVLDAFHCVETLQLIALNPESLVILQHIDLLIEKLKEINEPEKAKELEGIKERVGEEKVQNAMKLNVKSEN